MLFPAFTCAMCLHLGAFSFGNSTRSYYYNEENENIRIRLDKEQPRKQKNGFEIIASASKKVGDVIAHKNHLFLEKIL